MINFKTKVIETQWNSDYLNTKLRLLVMVIGMYMLLHYKVVMTITSIFREGDKGVHGYWRGVDIRVHDFKSGEAEELTNWINKMFDYDPKRILSVAVHHNVGQGDHIHLQVHPNTTFRI